MSDKLTRGLEGIIAVETSICDLDGESGRLLGPNREVWANFRFCFHLMKRVATIGRNPPARCERADCPYPHLSRARAADRVAWLHGRNARAAALRGDRPTGPPPAGYVCNICRVPGHWIHACPNNYKSKKLRLQRRKEGGKKAAAAGEGGAGR